MFEGTPVNVTVRVTVIHFVAVREMSEVRTTYVVNLIHLLCFLLKETYYKAYNLLERSTP